MDEQRLKRFVDGIGVTAGHRERHSGWDLTCPNGRVFGFVRFNQSGACTVYAYHPFDDPGQLFIAQPSSKGRTQRFTFDPSSEQDLRYAFAALRSSYRGHQ